MNQKQQIELLKRSAMRDPVYAALHEEALILENEFEQALLDLPEAVQDTVWRYLFQCEAQSERLLDLVIGQKLTPER